MEWSTIRLKKRIPQNDNSKILKIKIPTNPTTHPFTYCPSLTKKEKIEKEFAPISHAL
jgi:hypothetical protein